MGPAAPVGRTRGVTPTPAGRFEWERRFRSAALGKRGTARAATLAVGFAMATYADGDGSNIFPGRERLATDLGVSESTVKRELTALEGLGYLIKTREHNRSKGLAATYRLAVPLKAEQGSPVTREQGSPVTPHHSMDHIKVHALAGQEVEAELRFMERRREKDRATAEARLLAETTCRVRAGSPVSPQPG